MYSVETAYGQLLDMKLNQRYGNIKHGFWSVIALQVWVNFFTSTYYITLMAWSFSFLFECFDYDLPWTRGAAGNTLWNATYFDEKVLNKSTMLTNGSEMVPWMVFCMFAAYIFTYFSSWKGLRSIGSAVYFTCSLPYIILTILLITGLSLEGSGNGFYYLFKPNWSKLGEA